jgi:Papain family cysteine protease
MISIKLSYAKYKTLKSFFSFGLLLTCSILRGQGISMDSLYLDSIPVLPLYDGLKSLSLPNECSLKQYCPTPLDQKTTKFCAAFAFGYGAFTIEKQLPKAERFQKAYSAAFLFNKHHLPMNYPIDPFKVLRFMRDSGVCTVLKFNNALDNAERLVPIEAKIEAKQLKNRIKDFYAFSNTNLFQQIKKHLSQKHPVVVAVKTERFFRTIHAGKSCWYPKTLDGEQHAMVLIGYNETKKVFELMNSYDTTWGNKGFIEIVYDDFKKVHKCSYALVSDNRKSISDDPSDSTYTYIDSTQKESIGSIQVKRFVPKTQNDSAYFKNVEVQKDNDLPFLYHLKIASFWETPTIQLAVSNIPKGKNLYLFSLDAKDSVQINWPPNAQWTETDTISSNYYTPNFNKKNISPIIAEDSLTLLLPSPCMGMQVTHKGDDQIVMLITDEPIADFSHRIKQFKNTKGQAYERTQIVFGDVLIPLDDIDYMKHELSVKTRVYSTKGSVIPVFLTINKQY